MRALKLIIAALVCGTLAFGVFFAVNHVGTLNRQAAVLESCQQAQTSTPPTASQYPDCPQRPITKTEIASLRDQADTTGKLGWVAFIVLVFGMGGTLWEIVTDLRNN